MIISHKDKLVFLIRLSQTPWQQCSMRRMQKVLESLGRASQATTLIDSDSKTQTLAIMAAEGHVVKHKRAGTHAIIKGISNTF